MVTGPFSLSTIRRRELYRRIVGRKLWLAVAMVFLVSYLKYQRVLYGVSENLVMLAMALSILSALKGYFSYFRQKRFLMRFLLDGDELVLIYPNLKRIILDRNSFKSVSPDGGVLYFATGSTPVDSLFVQKISPLSRAVLDWLLGSEVSRAALYRSRDQRDELALIKEKGSFARIPRGRMHFYSQIVPLSLVTLGLYSRYVELIYFDDTRVIRLGAMLSALAILLVESAWHRAKRRVALLKEKQELSRLENEL